MSGEFLETLLERLRGSKSRGSIDMGWRDQDFVRFRERK